MCFERVQKVDNEKTLNINNKINKSNYFCDFLPKNIDTLKKRSIAPFFCKIFTNLILIL